MDFKLYDTDVEKLMSDKKKSKDEELTQYNLEDSKKLLTESKKSPKETFVIRCGDFVLEIKNGIIITQRVADDRSTEKE